MGLTCSVLRDNNPLAYILTSAKLDASGRRWVAAMIVKFISKLFQKTLFPSSTLSYNIFNHR